MARLLRGAMVGVSGALVYGFAEASVNTAAGFRLAPSVWLGAWLVYAVMGLVAGGVLAGSSSVWERLAGSAGSSNVPWMMAAFTGGLLFVQMALPINERALPDLLSLSSAIVNTALLVPCVGFGVLVNRRLVGLASVRRACRFAHLTFSLSLFLCAATYVDTYVADTSLTPLALAAYAVILLLCAALYGAGGVLLRWMGRPPQQAMVAIAIVLTLTGLARWAASAPSATVVHAGATGRPNVLWIIMDTVRRDHLSLHGHDRPTSPHVDALAAGAVVFEQAVAPASWTVPSHFEMVTSRVAAGKRTVLDAEYTTAAEIFRDHGYDTAAVVANLSLGRRSGFEQGFDTVLDGPAMVFYLRLFEKLDLAHALVSLHLLPAETALRWLHRKTFFEGEAVRADAITDRVIGWLGRRTERPFFLFVNYMDAHDAYDPPEAFRSRFAPGVDPEIGFVRFNRRLGGPISSNRFVRDVVPGMQPADWERLKVLYDGEIAYLDAQLGRLFAALEAQGLGERTIVVVTADHGELFGEHGLANHFKALSDEELRVPLIIRHPATFPPGRRISEPVELIDVLPTLLAAVEIDTVVPMDGRNLLPRLTGSPAAEPKRSEAFSLLLRRPDKRFPHTAAGHLLAIRTDEAKYVWSSTGQHAYYDLKADPLASRNLYVPDGVEIAALDRRVAAWRRAVGLDELDDTGGTSRIMRDRLRALGYVD